MRRLSFLSRLVVAAMSLACILALGAFAGCSSGGSADADVAAFVFHDGQGPEAGGDYAAELGCNTYPVFLDDWADFEPSDDAFDFESAFPGDPSAYDHVIVRIGILHVLAWGDPDAIPSWADPADIDSTFREEFHEFVRAAIEEIGRRNIDVDLYLVELEANYAGFEIAEKPAATNTWIIDWIGQVTAIVRELDPEAKIVVPLTPSDLRPGEIADDPTDSEKLLATEFARRMVDVGVDFDVIGFNVASGAYDRVDDWTTIADYLEEWHAFEKEIFVWSLGFPAEVQPDIPMSYPRAEGYSESWQAEQYESTMELLLADERVLGVSIDLYDYQEADWPEPISFGLVAGDPEDPASLAERPSFDAVRAVWEESAR